MIIFIMKASSPKENSNSLKPPCPSAITVAERKNGLHGEVQMSCQSMKCRQSRTKEGEMQPAWFQDKFRPGCTAWLDPEGRDRVGSSRGSGSGKAGSPLPHPLLRASIFSRHLSCGHHLSSALQRNSRGTGEEKAGGSTV